MYIAWSFASLGALKIITLLITNLQDRWCVCGTNCKIKENPSAAIWDDNEDIIQFQSSMLNFRKYRETILQLIVYLCIYLVGRPN